MIERHAVPIASIAWVAPADAGKVDSFFEPESVQELVALCRQFYQQQLPFDLIGHTSNILYTQGYQVERMVSTRKLTHYEIREESIVCDCGTHVRDLAQDAVSRGIKGFEGLIDLPGTLAAALYGNAGCYACSVSELLVEATLLLPDGSLQTVGPAWFHYTKRSSVLKRHEQEAVIVSATLRNEKGDPAELQRLAEENHRKRLASQPGPAHGLGSIFGISGDPTSLHRRINVLAGAYRLLLRWTGASVKTQKERTTHLALRLLGASELRPYVRAWNWYQWNDSTAHTLFWRFVQLHRRMFTRSDFEIEIKGMSPEAIERQISARQ